MAESLPYCGDDKKSIAFTDRKCKLQIGKKVGIIRGDKRKKGG